MSQVQLPIFPEGYTPISQEIGFQKQDGKVCYFNGHLPVFMHDQNDLRSFRLFTTQLYINGTVTQAQIVKAFGVPPITVKRYVKQYQERGIESFFQPAPRRTGRRLTPEVLVQVQELLDQGREIAEIEAELGILRSTVHKAIDSGRLRKADPAKKKRIAGSQALPSPRPSAR